MTAPAVSSRIFTHTVVIRLRGQVDAIGSGLLRHELVNAMMRRPPRRIVVDLRQATGLDPAAVGALLAAHEAAADVHATLTLRNASVGITAELADQGLPPAPPG
jgi:anti-anti-sigma regulatory factor